MSKWDKLLEKICTLAKDLRFDELRKILESYGYEMHAPKKGSSHFTFRKKDVNRLRYQSMSQLKRCMLNGKTDCGKRGW